VIAVPRRFLTPADPVAVEFIRRARHGERVGDYALVDGRPSTVPAPDLPAQVAATAARLKGLDGTVQSASTALVPTGQGGVAGDRGPGSFAHAPHELVTVAQERHPPARPRARRASTGARCGGRVGSPSHPAGRVSTVAR
jgi:hypothetical protein